MEGFFDGLKAVLVWGGGVRLMEGKVVDFHGAAVGVRGGVAEGKAD